MRRFNFRDGSTYFLVAGGISAASWFVGTVLGKHPDGGALLGFSAGMFAVWSSMRKDQQDQHDDDDLDEDQEWQEEQHPHKPTRRQRVVPRRRRRPPVEEGSEP